MQAAISASAAAAVTGKVAQVYIPTPETTIATSLQYDRLYPPRFSQPATYIRFSSTVEDCVGITYCLTAEDDAFLTSLNQQRSGHHETLPPCTEAQIEEVMDVFEQATQTAQPFAAVDCPSVLSYEELAASIDHSVEVGARPYATQIYEHWKSQRTQRGNRALMPGLKYETGQETDDSDPFVCFRRREVRQTRKTRGRDAQVVEKLRKLRRELEQARQLVHLVCQRETLRRDQLAIDRHIFEKRVAVKELKRTLGIKGDDDGLLTQKVSLWP